MKKTMKFTMGFAIAAILGVAVLTACGSGAAKTESQVEGQESNSGNGRLTGGKEPKELNIGVTSFADTLEPTEQYFSWVVSRYGVGETLVKFDQRGELEACLAEEWSVSEDHLSWIFRIREGVSFSNGELMTPELVKKSLERTFEMSGRAESFFMPESIEVDGQLLVIKTTEPVAIVPGSLADPLFLIVNTQADTAAFAMAGPVCTGPYVVESFQPSESCVVVKNQNYWGGEVPFDRVTLKCIDDQNTRSMALQAGEIDIAYNLKTENVVEFMGMDHIQIDQLESLRSTYAFLNQNGALADLALRQALICSLNKETYCSVLLEGGASPGKTPVPPTLDFGFDELVDENAYDQERAKALLAEAGYKDINGDGYVETPAGEPLDLNFVIYTSREELGVYAQAAQVNLKEVGIKVTLQTVSYETLLDMRDSGSYDLLIWNVLVANTGDPEKYLRENWYSTSASNTAGYKNAEVDQLLDQLASSFAQAEREDLIIQIQQLIINDAATAFFGYETTYLFYSKELTGVVLYPIDYYWLTNEVRRVD